MNKEQHRRAIEIDHEINYLKEFGMDHFTRQGVFQPMKIDTPHAEKMIQALTPLFEVYQKGSIAVIERGVKELEEEFAGL